MKIRFALTHVDKHGMRALTYANQGRNFFNTKEAADKRLADTLANNSEERLADVFGPQSIGTFEVRPVECYDNGDAVGVYFA